MAYRMRRNRVGGLSQPGIPRGNAIVCMCLRECVCVQRLYSQESAFAVTLKVVCGLVHSYPSSLRFIPSLAQKSFNILMIVNVFRQTQHAKMASEKSILFTLNSSIFTVFEYFHHVFKFLYLCDKDIFYQRSCASEFL